MYFTEDVGEWAELDYDEEECLVEHMRYCYKNRIVSNPAGVETAKKFSWEETARKIMEIL